MLFEVTRKEGVPHTQKEIEAPAQTQTQLTSQPDLLSGPSILVPAVLGGPPIYSKSHVGPTHIDVYKRAHSDRLEGQEVVQAVGGVRVSPCLA